MRNHKHRYRLRSSNEWFHRLTCECGRMCCWTRFSFSRMMHIPETIEPYTDE